MVKLIGLLLMIVNVSMHGVVALFIGGPVGLTLYLVGFIGLWTTAWLTLRRRPEAGARA